MSEGILASFFWDLNKLFDAKAAKSSWTEVQLGCVGAARIIGFVAFAGFTEGARPGDWVAVVGFIVTTTGVQIDFSACCGATEGGSYMGTFVANPKRP